MRAIPRIALTCPALALVLLTAPRCHGQAGVITTVAGGGTLTGDSANGGPATKVNLVGGQLSVAVDNTGNFYIGDAGAMRIWKVNAAGTISTVASNPDLISMSGIVVDSAGNIYASGANLLKITSSGVISTIAQVIGTNVAIDGAGNLYVADILHTQILKIDPDGKVSPFAGNGTAGFSGDGGLAVNAQLSLPQGVAADAAGNVYFCDSGNLRVRKVDTFGKITTVAGNGTGLAIGDGGPATSAGMTPTFVSVDGEGNLYILDAGAARIRKVNAAGTIDTVAGGGSPLTADYGDGGPATSAYLGRPTSGVVDLAGNLYITDEWTTAKVRKVASGAVGSPIQATPSQLSFSYTAGDPPPPTQNVTIISLGSTLTFTATTTTTSGGDWLKVTPDHGNVDLVLTISVNPTNLSASTYNGTVIITPSGSGNAPQTVAVKLIVNEPVTKGVISTVAGNGFLPFTAEGGLATSSAMGVTAVTVDDDGNLYIADVISSKILKVSRAGIVTTLAGNGAITFAGDDGPATQASFFSPYGVAVDGSGNVYIADTFNNRIRRVDGGGNIATVAGNGALGFSGDGGPATKAELWNPMDVAVDNSGNLYIADTGNDRIRKVSANGTITTVAGGALLPGYSGDGGPAVGAALFQPGGVAVDRAGNIYIADIDNNRIRKVSAAGTISTVAGNGTKGFTGDGGPAASAELNLFSAHVGLSVDSAGNLYIPDVSNNRVRRVDAGGTIATIAGNGIGGFSGDGGPATSAGLNNPIDVEVDSAGNLFIADTTNNRVREVKMPTGSPAPSISSNGIVNGASFQPGIVPNSWATILGANLSPVTDTWDNFIVNGKLPTSLHGVSVTVGGESAYIYYVSSGQINFVVPDISAGATQVVVTTPSGISSTYTVTANAYAPAFFAWPNNQPVATRQDYTYAAKNGTFAGATTIPAKPGDVIILWGTGFGPTLAVPPAGVEVPADQTYSTMTLPAVTINNVPATVYGAALAPGFAGLYQVAIQVPDTLADGDWPIVATIGGVSSPSSMVLSVHQ
jgi:uncharacterized protein (TIGR03437 family)